MTLYLETLKTLPKTIRNPKLFKQNSRIQINIQKKLVVLDTNNEHTEKEIRETIPFTIASKTIKYVRINLMKENKDFLVKTMNH
jgi:hypothetical protein